MLRPPRLFSYKRHTRRLVWSVTIVASVLFLLALFFLFQGAPLLQSWQERLPLASSSTALAPSSVEMATRDVVIPVHRLERTEDGSELVLTSDTHGLTKGLLAPQMLSVLRHSPLGPDDVERNAGETPVLELRVQLRFSESLPDELRAQLSGLRVDRGDLSVRGLHPVSVDGVSDSVLLPPSSEQEVRVSLPLRSSDNATTEFPLEIPLDAEQSFVVVRRL